MNEMSFFTHHNLTSFETCQTLRGYETRGFHRESAGRLISAPGHPGILAFLPNPLQRDLETPTKIAMKIEAAARLIGKLTGEAAILNPWVHLFLRREAIASSAIEGTITTARELYAFETGEVADDAHREKEVLNYVNAATRGLELIAERGLSLNVLLQIHEVMMTGVRGSSKRPGEFRKEQNAISHTKRIEDARFVPPPVPQMTEALHDLETFIHEPPTMPDLVRLALVHYQFETIHPFLDGNGRVGRLMMPLLLCEWGTLPHGPPKLYLSNYLERNDAEYRERLLRVSQNGEWHEWIAFFLDGVIEEASETLRKARELSELHTDYIRRLGDCPSKLLQAVSYLFYRSPVVKVRDIADFTRLTRQRAGEYVERMVELRMLTPGEKKYGRLYFANEIMRVFFGEDAGKPEPETVSDESPHATLEGTSGRPKRLFDAPPES